MSDAERLRLARCLEFWARFHERPAIGRFATADRQIEHDARAATYRRLADFLSRENGIQEFMDHSRSFGFEKEGGQ